MNIQTPQPLSASFFRRLAALIYDMLILFALVMFAELVFLLILQTLTQVNLIQLTAHQDISSLLRDNEILAHVNRAYLYIVGCCYFIYFWLHGGQTLGMKTWRLRLETNTEESLTYKQVIVRAIFSMFGLGNLILLLGFRKALQDRISQTQVVYLKPACIKIA